jgi:hypothetical protein
MIIKQCQAAEKQEAAVLFADRPNRMAEGTFYTPSELFPAIKREDELTEEERHLVIREDPTLLLL